MSTFEALFTALGVAVVVLTFVLIQIGIVALLR